MPVRVLGPDGKTYSFPDGTDKAAAIRYFKKQGVTGPPALAAKPAGEGFWHSLGAQFGLTPEAAQAAAQDRKDHPIKNALVAALGPGGQLIQGLYEQGKVSANEIAQSYQAEKHGNSAAAVVHAVQAVPIVGPAISKAADQSASGDTGGEFGTLLGGAAQAAPIVAGAAEKVPGVKAARDAYVAAGKAKYRPTNLSLTPDEIASQKLVKALSPPIRAVERIKGATGEVPTVKAYAARNGIKINGKLDFAKAAEGAAKEIQSHYDTKLLRPHGGEQVTVPENYNGERFSHGSNRATLNQVNDRVNQINQELKSNFRKTLASETSQAQASDAELNAEKQQLTGILHEKLADLTGLQPEDVASVRQRAGKLRTLAEEAKLSGNQDTLSLSREEAGSRFATSKEGLAKAAWQKYVKGGPEVIGNRALNKALEDFKPASPELPKPLPPASTTPTTPEAAQQEFLRANQTEQSAQDAAAARNAEAEHLRTGNVDTQRQAAQQEAVRATQGEQSSQDLAAARSRFAASRRAANTDAATTANKAAAESEVRKAAELENAAQDASADRSDLASQLRDKTDAGTPPAQEDVNTRPAAAPPPSPGPIALPAPAEPTIEEKEVTPADPARGVQSVTLPVVTHPLGSVTGIDHDSGLPIVKRADPVALPAETPAAPLPAEPPSRTLPSSGKVIELPASTTPGPQSSALPPPETHVFSPEMWSQANPDGDVVAAQQAAKAAGYEIEA